MAARTYIGGHAVYFDDEDKVYRYEKNGEIVGSVDICPKCGGITGQKGEDPCLGMLPGVKNACCGHGKKDGYIQFKNGTIIRFQLKAVEKDGFINKF